LAPEKQRFGSYSKPLLADALSDDTLAFCGPITSIGIPVFVPDHRDPFAPA
jgi:hypothetical protein